MSDGRNTWRSLLGRAATTASALLLAVALVAALAACGDDGDTAEPAASTGTSSTTTAPSAAADTAPAQKLKVVTTSNIAADWARNVGGDRVEVRSLLPIGTDPHSYQPSARDVTDVASADLVFTIGLSLEDAWMEELVHNASADESRVIVLGEVISPIEFREIHGDHMEHDDHGDDDGHGHDDDHGDDDHADDDDHGHDDDHADDDDHEDDHGDDDHGHEDDDDHGDDDHEDEHGEDEHDDHGHGMYDPHFWFDPPRVKVAVQHIAEQFAALDPAGAATYQANAAAYAAELDALHAWTESTVSAVPADHRILVTSHDSFQYFADLYGFEVVGTLLPGLSPDVEPSAQHLHELVETLEEHPVPAVFGETTVSDRLAQAIAAETDSSFQRLYSGSLGPPGSGADTYIGMARANVETIVNALK